MSINYRSMVAVLGAAALCTACNTTGDPRSGGIFWSPSKAQARQNELLSIQDQAQQAATAAESRTGSLRSQINSLRARIAAKKDQLNTAGSVAEADRLRAEIRKLENDLDSLYSL